MLFLKLSLCIYDLRAIWIYLYIRRKPISLVALAFDLFAELRKSFMRFLRVKMMERGATEDILSGTK